MYVLKTFSKVMAQKDVGKIKIGVLDISLFYKDISLEVL